MELQPAVVLALIVNLYDQLIQAQQENAALRAELKKDSPKTDSQ